MHVISSLPPHHVLAKQDAALHVPRLPAAGGIRCQPAFRSTLLTTRCCNWQMAPACITSCCG